MDPVLNAGFRKNLFRWIGAITILAGFFTGYTSQAKSQLTSRTQTEWVESRKPFKKVHSVFEKESTAPSEFNNLTLQSEFFILLAKSRLIHILCKANQKLIQSIPAINSIHFEHRPDFSDEDFISA